VKRSAHDGGFGELLREGRRAARVNQRQLADRAGVSLAAIRDLEQGRTSRPRPQLLEALVVALNLTGEAAAAFRAAADPSDRGRPTRAVDPGGPVRLGVLGPLSIQRGLGPVPVGRGRRRAVLGRLALSPNVAVPLPELVDLLWDAGPPAAPAQIVQTYVSRLRSALQPAGPGRSSIISRIDGGYQLNLTDDQFDLAEFRGYVDQAGAAAPVHALDLLETALKLWRGSPLGDVPELRHHPLVAALADERVAVALCHADLAIDEGQAERCLPMLHELAAANPFHEPLHARLLAALSACDLQAAALAAYADIRRRLIDDLGVEPGPELSETHLRVLRQEPARPVRVAANSGPAVPAQLPLDAFGFTGRQAELAELDRTAQLGAAQPTAVFIAVISGTAGVGKTALAVRWGHRVRGRFPDGQVYVDLRGYDPDLPLSAADALHRLLSALGVPGPDIPAELDERAARYRTRVADRRLLIVLDNASSVEQVRPLLPGTGTCAVLVTSRDALTGLVAAHGAHRLSLDLLSPGDAAALLRRLIGDRVEAEPGAAATLAEQCARLPLALRVAAELAVSRPATPLTDLVSELADQRRRLELLDAGGDPRSSVTAVFSWSTRHLPDDVVHAFGLLGLHPGMDFDHHAAAALIDVAGPRARDVLAVLVRAHLVHATGPDRYGIHDLLRAYAAGLAGNGRSHHASAALTRLFDHYVATASVAIHALFPTGTGPRQTVPAAATTPALGDGDALRWLDAELTCLTAVAAYTATRGWPTRAVRLAETLHRYLVGGHAAEALVIHGHARDAAQQTGDRSGVAHADVGLGIAQRQLGRYATATDHFERALTAFRQLGDRSGAGRALYNLGAVEQQQRHYDESAEYYRRAIAAFREAGDEDGMGDSLNNLGMVEHSLGHDAAAADHHRQAVAIHRRTGDRIGEATGLTDLGIIELRLGRPGRAADHHRTALALFLETGDLLGEAWARNGLGEATTSLGRPADAIDHHTTALDTATRIGDRDQQARAHAGLGDAHRALRDPARAREHYQRAVTLFTELGLPEAELLRVHLDGVAEPA
jgi:DNA-binding SARP family transcriptional activator/tetratricopeptide (TPR) repeat protein